MLEESSGDEYSESEKEEAGKHHFEPGEAPKAFKEKEHPFSSRYQDHQGYRECINEGTARKLVSMYTLDDCQKFRNQGLSELETLPTDTWAAKVREPQLPMVSTIDFQSPHAYYVVIKHLGSKDYLLEAVHREVPANDRPDLFRLLKTRFSRNMENVNSSLMMEGDLIVVYKLRRRSTTTNSQVLATFDSVKKYNSQIFWEVLCYSVVVRRMADAVPIAELALPKQKENKKKKYFIGLDELQIIVGDTDLFPNSHEGIHDRFHSAKVFFPMVNPGQLLSASPKGQDEYDTLVETAHHNTSISFFPTVIKAGPLCHDIADMLHSTYDGNDDRHIEKCLTLCHFGLSGKYSLKNKDHDRNIYPTEIVGVEMTFSRPSIKFDISQSLLKEKVEIKVSFSPTHHVLMIVDHNEWMENCIRITATMSERTSTLLPPFDTLHGRSIIVTQTMYDFKRELDAFSRYSSMFQDCVNPNLRAFLIVSSGSVLKEQNEYPWNRHLTDQEIYVKAFDRYPVVLLDGNRSTGKTYSIARTAIRLAQKSDFPSLHVITAKLEWGTNQLTSQFLRRLKQVEGRSKAPRAVRLNNKRDDYETIIDFEKLYPEVLRSYVLDIDEKWLTQRYPREEEDRDLTMCAVKYLVDHGKLHPNELRSEAIYGRLSSKNFHPKYNVVECFLKIYKPDIIIGTIPTLLEAFDNDWKTAKRSVENVQIDEAHQIYKSEAYSLAFTFPNAKFAMVGDSIQSRNRQCPELPETLSAFCESDPFRLAIQANPTLTFKLNVTHKKRPNGGVCLSRFNQNLTESREILEFEDPDATPINSDSEDTE